MAEEGSLPGPPGRFLIGNLLDLDLSIFQKQLSEWAVEYGPMYQFSVFGKKAIVLSSVDLMKEAFEEKGEVTSGRPPTASGHFVAEYNDIVFNGNYEIIKEMKRLYEHSLNSDKKMQTIIEKGMQTACEILRRNLSTLDGKEVDMREAMDSAHVNFISHLLIGESLPEASEDYSAVLEFANNVNRLLHPAINKALVSFPFLKYLPYFEAGQIVRRALAARTKLTETFFTKQKETWSKDVCRGLVDIFLAKQREGETTHWPTDENIKGVIWDTIFGGPGQQMKSCLILSKLLCAFPEMQARIQSEIDAAIGQNEFPTDDMRSKMPFTEAAMLESMRYCNHIRLTVPHVCTDDLTLAGHRVEKGTVLIGNMWAILHSEDIWGDPLVYRPDRFLDDAGQVLPASSTEMKSFVQFSVGSRKCPGDVLAKNFVFRFITSLLHKFTILPADGAELPPPEDILHVAPFRQPVLQCRFAPRS